MEINETCVKCMTRRHLDRASKLGDGEQLEAFRRELEQILTAEPRKPAPCYAPAVAELFEKYYGLSRDFMREEKASSNSFALRLLPGLEERVRSAPDRLLRGLQGAILGNYLDFGALHGHVDFKELEGLLENIGNLEIDQSQYRAFLRELEGAGELLYLTDNAGEVAFDLVFGRVLKEAFPKLRITFCVRGGPALNDATRQDAAEVGLDREFPVIDSGAAISGTYLPEAGEELRQALARADLILAKGQGNAETLLGCGRNVYYAFLCKCERFRELFHAEQLQVMFLREPKKLNNP